VTPPQGAWTRGRRPASTGFSLLELVAAMSIVLVLATIAVPSYTAQLRKTRRVEAVTALLQTARALEKCFAVHGSYLADPDGDGNPGCAVADRATTRSGDYQITIGLRTATAYELTATPAAGGRQQADRACTSLTIDATGLKGATGLQPESCW